MTEVASWMIESLRMILMYFKENPHMGIGTFIIAFPLLKLLGRVLKLMIKTN